MHPESGALQGIYFHAHRNHDGCWLAGAQVQRTPDGRPIAYVALHGHGTYPVSGKARNPTICLQLVFYGISLDSLGFRGLCIKPESLQELPRVVNLRSCSLLRPAALPCQQQGPHAMSRACGLTPQPVSQSLSSQRKVSGSTLYPIPGHWTWAEGWGATKIIF